MIKNLTTKSLLALLISVSVIVGCSDDDDVALNKCFITKSSATYSKGETEETVYTYNSENKVIKSVGTYTAGSDFEIYTTVLTYDSKGLLIKEESDDVTTTYTYDANGKLIKEEYVSDGTYEDRSDYEYNSSGQLTKEQDYSVTNGVATKGSYTTYEYSNTTTKNPLRTKSYSQAGNLSVSTDFEYDDKKTPYSDLNLSTLIAAGENNITKVTFSYGGSTQISTYAYEYNEKGYPTKLTQKNNSGTTTSTEIYTYDCK